MTADAIHRLDVLSNRPVESLATVTSCVQEIQKTAHHGFNADSGPIIGFTASRLISQTRQRSLIDEPSLSIIWKGKSLYLGHTQPFRLLERLAKRPNQYITQALGVAPGVSQMPFETCSE